ncbi:MAG: bacterioferritin-associated ferredoxin [Spongiibacteraceae bacterium]|jgi:bacterioferritin-associated ferredoxin|nr:bacterioferritin-associated ferredoxin [Spongiibacteraceae bacterium]
MYICLCKGITDRQIRRAVHEGAGSYRAVRECLGVATQCGKCGCHARAVVKEALGTRQVGNMVQLFPPQLATAAAG